jgi:hypothetical protein
MSLIFPKDYGEADSDTVPMIGFGASEILKGSGINDLKPGPVDEWVWLPIPPEGVSTSYQQGWEETTQGAMRAGAEAGAKGISSWVKGFGKDDSGTGGDATNANVLKWGSVKTAAAEAVKKQLGFSTGINTRALEQTYVAYSGPSYRAHNFSFKLQPKSKKDNEVIDDIVFYFKKWSAPFDMGGTANILRLYKTPHLFEIKFAPAKLQKSLPRIGNSALTGFDVKYGGDKFNVYEEDKRPSEVNITLSFKEMKILSRKDIDDGY